MSRQMLRIANCSGFFGDRRTAARELFDATEFDVLTGDWLAELTMLILQKQRARDPLRGFASTFVSQVEQVLGTSLDRGTKIVSNAGGVNPAGCAEALHAVADRLGLSVSIGTVTGDEITENAVDLQRNGLLTHLEDGRTLDLGDGPLAANAYLGGWGIASCLSAGADIVVTGRVTDAALVVGPSAWAFDWNVDDWDALAGAVVAGHVIECGAQATGGNFAFFDEVPDMVRLGFPIAEMRPDGSCVITKAPGTGGMVTVDTVTAQLLYEIGGPKYHNADVTARIDSAVLTQEARDRVAITGVRGEPAPSRLKVSIAVEGGHRNSMTLALTGLDIPAKAAVAEAAIWDLFPEGRETFEHSEVELLGRPVDDPRTTGESVAMLRIAVADRDPQLVGRNFSSAVVETGLASYPGFFMTTPPTSATSYAEYRPGLIDSTAVPHLAEVDGKVLDVPEPVRGGAPLVEHRPSLPPIFDGTDGAVTRLPLGRLCGARSGDKGGHANVGLWARSSEVYAWMLGHLTPEFFATLLPSDREFVIERHELPDLLALNFVVKDWLGTGVSSCLLFDSQAKGLGEHVRARFVDVPEHLAP